MRPEKYITYVATQIVGKKRLEFFIKKRKEKEIKPHTIRQMFLQDVKSAICNMSPETLGRICTYGINLGDEGMIVTTGTNPWSAMFLSTADSGRTLLQKVAVATLLSVINNLINDGQPHLDDSWLPIELVGKSAPCTYHGLEDRLREILCWESS